MRDDGGSDRGKRGLRILVVEAHEDLGDLLLECLELLGFEARLVASPSRALAESAPFRPHIVFLDLENLRSVAPQVVAQRNLMAADGLIVGMTVEFDRMHAREEIEHQLGLDLLLLKPFHIAPLTDCLSRAFATHRA